MAERVVSEDLVIVLDGPIACRMRTGTEGAEALRAMPSSNGPHLLLERARGVGGAGGLGARGDTEAPAGAVLVRPVAQRGAGFAIECRHEGPWAGLGSSRNARQIISNEDSSPTSTREFDHRSGMRGLEWHGAVAAHTRGRSLGGWAARHSLERGNSKAVEDLLAILAGARGRAHRGAHYDHREPIVRGAHHASGRARSRE